MSEAHLLSSWLALETRRVDGLWMDGVKKDLCMFFGVADRGLVPTEDGGYVAKLRVDGRVISGNIPTVSSVFVPKFPRRDRVMSILAYQVHVRVDDGSRFLLYGYVKLGGWEHRRYRDA